MAQRFSLTIALAILAALPPGADTGAAPAAALSFTHVVVDSFPPRNQHAKTVGDINGDGFDDILTSSALLGDGLYWYAYPTWSKHTIIPPDSASFGTEMQVGDVDGDGDLDVVVPQRLEETVWWYENPRPLGNPETDPWTEHLIGSAKGHDLELGDIDRDGRLDVVVREDSTILFVQTPGGGWTATNISDRNEEGLSLGDIDDDGDLDVAINSRWLENPLPAGDPSLDPWAEHLVDSNWPDRVGVHICDINGDGRLDIVLVPSESANGRLSWYDAPMGPAGAWVETVIDNDVSYVHTFKSADMDLDGDLDLVTAEMEQSSDPDEVSVYLNQGEGLVWTQQIVATTGSHNIRITDIGLDGDIDIVGANWNGQQVLDLWQNDLDPKLDLDAWQRRVVDDDKPWASVFVTSADLDDDGLEDIVTGGWWYRNPGSAAGAWARDSLGTGLNNMACVIDADRDGDLDVLGTRGVGAQDNDSLVWARNDGAGFTILDNIESANGDFLQGVAVVPGLDGVTHVFLSWHDTTSSLQRLSVPADPSNDLWPWVELPVVSQHEALSAADIDRDGDPDLLQGTRWLRNDSTAWTPFDVTVTLDTPDRNRLADINRDGRLDAVIGYQAVSANGTLAWYEQGNDATALWTEHVIASITGPMSIDAADMDGDGDIDVVAGEHNLAAPQTAALYVFENTDGAGTAWTQHTVYVGDEHHDGARAVDIDRDGDMDIISIGWSHGRVLLYENRAITGGGLINDPPVAAVDASTTSGAIPLLVDFDASASFDPDADSLTFTWDFGDSSPPDSGAVVQHVYTEAGVYYASVTVSDGELMDVAGVNITAGTLAGPTAGLIHHWRFDENTGAVAGDSAGSADGTLSGGAGWEGGGGRTGSAMRFNGTDGAVEIGAVDVESDSGLTIALWFKADDFDVHDARFISKTTGNQTADHFWMLSTIDQTALRFRLRAGGTTDLLLTDTGQIEAGRWYHVAATYDGATMRIYRNGEEVASAPKTGILDTDSTVLAAIGNQPAGLGHLPFDGLIDDVRIYNRPLGPAQIDSLVTWRFTGGVIGSGDIVLTPDQPDYVAGDTVLVGAVPATNWGFAGWSGGLSGGENPDTVIVVADTSVTATFVRTHAVVDRFVAGAGSLVVVPDTSVYALGDTVVFAAVADTGWVFAGWSGALAGTSNPDTLVVEADTSVTASFAAIPFVLSRETVGSGGIVVDPDTSAYAFGDTVVVSAVPETGWAFTGWSGALSGTANPDTLVMTGDTTLTATFTAISYSLTDSVTGAGSIVIEPDTNQFAYGDTVVVTAVADSNWVFDSWVGGLSGTRNPDTVVVVSDTTVTARFTAAGFAIDITMQGSGNVVKVPDLSAYAAGDTVVLTAQPDSAWSFSGWTGDVESELNPDTVVVDSSMAIVAVFEPTVTVAGGARAPSFVTLLANFPNPFSRETTIRYGLPTPGRPVLEVFDVRGRRVFRRELPGRAPGWHDYRFDPLRAGRGRMPSGVYFYRLDVDGEILTRRMVLLK